MIKFLRRNCITAQARLLRESVFIKEQGVSRADEYDSNEDAFFHCYLYEDSMLVGYARFSLNGEIAHIGRVAIVMDRRGKGYGRELLKRTEREVLACGGRTIEISAQMQAKDFYEKQGYKALGDVFIDAGISHIKMMKLVL